ncbi:MAG: hypothetical protein HC813_03995 [Planctomycetes bacterium]|nr:hypothetical protein [Planctomycetota bacterium]
MRTVALLLLCAAVASADTVIEELSRPFFLEGDYPDRTLPVRIRFAKERGLPETITGFNVKEQVLCYARANGGEWTLLSRSGWTPWELTTWLPTSLLAKRGRLDVKVNVHGVDSRLFVAAIRPPPAQKPEILSLRPDRLELTDGSESVGMSLEFRHADEWGFVSVQLGKSGCALGRVDVEADDRGRVHFWFPKERLTKSALYPVTVTTRGGISEAVELRVGEDPIKLRETPVRPVRHESKGVVARPEAPDRRLGVHGNTLLLESDFRIERVVRQGGRGAARVHSRKAGYEGRGYGLGALLPRAAAARPTDRRHGPLPVGHRSRRAPSPRVGRKPAHSRRGPGCAKADERHRHRPAGGALRRDRGDHPLRRHHPAPRDDRRPLGGLHLGKPALR